MIKEKKTHAEPGLLTKEQIQDMFDKSENTKQSKLDLYRDLLRTDNVKNSKPAIKQIYYILNRLKSQNKHVIIAGSQIQPKEIKHEYINTKDFKDREAIIKKILLA